LNYDSPEQETKIISDKNIYIAYINSGDTTAANSPVSFRIMDLGGKPFAVKNVRFYEAE
jgi:hypothetical protein